VVEACSGNAGCFSSAGHTFSRPGYVRKSDRKECPVFLFKRRINVFLYVLLCFKVVSNVKLFCFKNLYLLCNFFGFFIIMFLRGFVHAAKEYYYLFSFVDEIQSEAGA
jgi:hypothetical protein